MVSRSPRFDLCTAACIITTPSSVPQTPHRVCVTRNPSTRPSEPPRFPTDAPAASCVAPTLPRRVPASVEAVDPRCCMGSHSQLPDHSTAPSRVPRAPRSLPAPSICLGVCLAVLGTLELPTVCPWPSGPSVQFHSHSSPSRRSIFTSCPLCSFPRVKTLQTSTALTSCLVLPGTP
jgi:hypothetical protein